MPIDKLEKSSVGVDSSSITTNKNMRYLCCHKCGEVGVTLRVVKDEYDKRIKPTRFICTECYKANKRA